MMNVIIYQSLTDWFFGVLQTDHLQYDSVVKANIGERPVHYHHVCVEDLSSQLQQAEHCTPMKLCEKTRWKNITKEKKKICETLHLCNISTFNCIT